MWNEKESWALESAGNVHMYVDFIPSEPTVNKEEPSMDKAKAEREGNFVTISKMQRNLPFCIVGEDDNKRFVTMDLNLGFEIQGVTEQVSLENLAKGVDKAFMNEDVKDAVEQLDDNLLSWKLYGDTFTDEIERVMDSSFMLSETVKDVLDKELIRTKETQKPAYSKEEIAKMESLEICGTIGSVLKLDEGYVAYVPVKTKDGKEMFYSLSDGQFPERKDKGDGVLTFRKSDMEELARIEFPKEHPWKFLYKELRHELTRAVQAENPRPSEPYGKPVTLGELRRAKKEKMEKLKRRSALRSPNKQQSNILSQETLRL